MYGKLFSSMYDGSLVESWQALVTFQQMIVLCDADGVIDMTPEAISRRTGIPLEIIKAGIEILERPDERSRTPDENGKRIIRIDAHRDWGWFLVNHEKYKSMQDSDTVRVQNRERKRRQREREKASRSVTDGHSPSRHTDTDTDTIESTIVDSCAELSTKAPAPPALITIPLSKKGQEFHVTKALVDQYADSYPGVDVMLALKDIRQWNLDNPAKRKTNTGVKSHITRWLSRAQNKGEYKKSGAECASEPEYRRKIRQQKSLEDACN